MIDPQAGQHSSSVRAAARLAFSLPARVASQPCGLLPFSPGVQTYSGFRLALESASLHLLKALNMQWAPILPRRGGCLPKLSIQPSDNRNEKTGSSDQEITDHKSALSVVSDQQLPYYGSPMPNLKSPNFTHKHIRDSQI